MHFFVPPTKFFLYVNMKTARVAMLKRVHKQGQGAKVRGASPSRGAAGQAVVQAAHGLNRAASMQRMRYGASRVRGAMEGPARRLAGALTKAVAFSRKFPKGYDRFAADEVEVAKAKLGVGDAAVTITYNYSEYKRSGYLSVWLEFGQWAVVSHADIVEKWRDTILVPSRTEWRSQQRGMPRASLAFYRSIFDRAVEMYNDNPVPSKASW